MVLCALAGLSASLRSAANLPAAAHKNFIFAPHNIIYYYERKRMKKLALFLTDVMNQTGKQKKTFVFIITFE
jgi:hypothetical protein